MSEPIPDGGPAFPQNIAHSPLGDVVTTDMYFADKSGISVRDYLAAKALALKSVDYGPGQENRTAELAYAVADALLAARNQPAIPEGAGQATQNPTPNTK